MRPLSFLRAALALAAGAGAAVLAPVNPNATPKAKAVYTYLQNIKGQGILSGQESMLWDSSSAGTYDYSAASPYSFRDRYVSRLASGKFPALYESDFGDVGTGTGVADRARIVSILKARAPKGAIFMLNWHTANPAMPDGDGYTGSKTLTNSAAIIDSMLKPGTAYNVEWLRRLDVIGGYLQQLRDSNIVVMWRPFHENNGNFFWWGQQPRFKELWSQMYHRFTDTLKLDNLLWVYNSNHFGSSDTWVRRNYPGDSLVDILAVDVYRPYFNYEKTMYDTLMAVGGGKPVGISENGAMPDVPKLFAEGQHYAFFCTWWGFEGATRNDGLLGNPDSLYVRNYGSAYTITEDEINFAIVPDGKKTLGVTATAGGSVAASPVGRVDSGTVVTLTATPEAGYDFAGWTGDTTVAATVNPLVVKVVKDRSIKAVFTPGAATNLVKQGNFAASTSWGFYAATGNTATVDYASGKAVVLVSAQDDTAYHIQLSQSGIALDSGVTYILGFTASATAARTLNIGFSGGAPGWKWLGGGEQAIGTVAAPYTVEITTLGSSAGAILQFNLGGKTGTVTLDDVTLVRKATTPPVPTTNLVKQGDFAASTSWGFYAATGNTATVDYASGKAVVLVSAQDDTAYHIQLSQSGIALDSGATYVLSFTASATAARTLNIGFSGGAPGWKWLGGGQQDITTTSKTYSLEIKAQGTSAAAILQFNVGGALGTLTLDDVSLVLKPGTSSVVRSAPAQGPLQARRLADGFSWTLAQPLAKAASLRVLTVDGREIALATVPAGQSRGRFVGHLPAGLLVATLDGRSVRLAP